MRVVKPGDIDIALKVGESIKYVVSEKHQYILMALYGNHNSCMGCVFQKGSGHPLSGMVGCLSTGLQCDHRIFKPVDTLLEDL